MHDDEWEDEARWEAEQDAAGEEAFEKLTREWVRENAAELAHEFFETNYEKAVKVFRSERLKSFYIEHPELAGPALETLNYARTLLTTHPRAALVFATTSIELLIKSVLLRPLISGLVHSEDFASLIVEQSTNQIGLGHYQKLLAGIVSEFSSFELSTLKRPNSNQTLWQEIKTVQEARNGVIHRGDTVEEEMATRSVEIADMLLNVIFPDVLSKLGLHTHLPITICDKTHQEAESPTPKT